MTKQKPQKKEKATFGLVLVYALMFAVADIVIALSVFRPFLIILGPLELATLAYMSLKAVWNAFPKKVQKGLTKLSKY